LDKLIQPPKFTGATKTETTFAYCGYGSPSTVTRASNLGGQAETTTTQYNYWGQPTQITGPDSVVLNLYYDALGRDSSRVDSYQSLTRTFDNLNRLISQVNGIGPVESRVDSSTRDWATTLTDANGVASTLTYDLLGRLRTQTKPDGGVEHWGYTVGFPAATKQLESEDTTLWASSKVTLGYTSRLRTSLALQWPNTSDWSQSYTYDSARWLQTLTSPSGNYTYAYVSAAGTTASRLVQSISIPTTAPSSTIANTYDTTGHQLSTTLKTGTTIHNSHSYLVNTAHERYRQTRPDTTYVDYTYDNAEQLSTSLSYYSGGGTITTEQLKYGYDAGQNMVKRTNDTTVATYTANSLNQVTSGDGSSYGYDLNGNRTSKDYTNYAYDDENQLITAYVETPSVPTSSYWRTEFTYDARGWLRIRKEYTWAISSWSLSSETRYVYDGMRVIQERNSGNTPLVTYTWGLDRSGKLQKANGIGGMLGRTAHSGASGGTLTSAFYHADANGSIRI